MRTGEAVWSNHGAIQWIAIENTNLHPANLSFRVEQTVAPGGKINSGWGQTNSGFPILPLTFVTCVNESVVLKIIQGHLETIQREWSGMSE